MLVLGSLLRCGDALCTMAAQASTGTEFFVTDLTAGRLNRQQRAFSGNRFSDHVAAFNAFQVVSFGYATLKFNGISVYCSPTRM